MPGIEPASARRRGSLTRLFMNVIGKIFVFAVFVMSLMLMTFAGVIYMSHVNWKDEVYRDPNDLLPGQQPGYVHQIKKAQEERAGLEAEIHARAGEPFNVNSPAQVGEILFGKLGLMYSRSETGGVRDSGYGETYGLGVDISINRQWAGVLQYDRSAVHFSGGRDRMNLTSVGLKYRY
jgi:hypothetical protein